MFSYESIERGCAIKTDISLLRYFAFALNLSNGTPSPETISMAPMLSNYTEGDASLVN
jgi:hypothetical protein